MKRLIYIVVALMLALGVTVNCHAQTKPIKVKDMFGESVKLEPLKTGRYSVQYIVDASGNLVNAPGVMLAIVNDQTISIGMAMSLVDNGFAKVRLTSMGNMGGWKTTGDRFVNASPATPGYVTVAAYSKKYNQLVIDGTDGKGHRSSIVVLYEPKPDNGLSEAQLQETIFKIGEQPENICIFPKGSK